MSRPEDVSFSSSSMRRSHLGHFMNLPLAPRSHFRRHHRQLEFQASAACTASNAGKILWNEVPGAGALDQSVDIEHIEVAASLGLAVTFNRHVAVLNRS